MVIVGGVGLAGFILYKKGVFTPVTNVINTVTEIPQKVIEKVTETVDQVNDTMDNTPIVSDIKREADNYWNTKLVDTGNETVDLISNRLIKANLAGLVATGVKNVWDDATSNGGQNAINTGQSIVKATPVYQLGKKLFGWD